MKIEKLPSGKYRVRKMVKGRTYTIVLSYKPSQKEAHQMIEDKRTGRDKIKLTFDEAAQEYIDGKRNTLSPSTIRGYESLRKNLPDSIRKKPIGEITPWDVQRYINDLSAEHTPKTVRNYHGFIATILSTFCPDIVLHTNLPQRKKKDVYIPTDEEVKKIFEYIKGTDFEIPYRLACYGLRRSEICALTPDDLQGNRLTISKAMVQDENYNWITKTTKTTDSTRTIIIDSPLSTLIRSQNRIYDGNPHNLYDHLQIVLKRLNIRPFPLHVLRHYYASTAHAMGIPDAVIMASGGWKTDHVMKNVYRHEKRDQVEQLQEQYAEVMTKSMTKYDKI